MRHFRHFGSKLNLKSKAILSMALSTDSIILLTAFWTILRKYWPLYGWVCFRRAIGQFAVCNLLYGSKFQRKCSFRSSKSLYLGKKGWNSVTRRLSTLRTWMLTLAFNILNCVYLWTKTIMRKLSRNLIEDDSSQCLKILS